MNLLQRFFSSPGSAENHEPANEALATGSRKPDFETDAFPIEISPRSRITSGLERLLNHGEKERLRHAISQIPFPDNGTLAIDVRDTSSSMSRFSGALIEGERAFKTGLEQIPRGSVGYYQMWINKELRLSTPDGPIDLRDAYHFRREDFRMKDNGGVLTGGSRLSDGLFAAAELALAHKAAGMQNNISINMIADGWNRHPSLHTQATHQKLGKWESPTQEDWQTVSEQRTRNSLDQARAQGVSINFVAFVTQSDLGKLTDFVNAVGLKPKEVQIKLISPLRDSAAEKEVTEAFTLHSKSVLGTVDRHSAR